GRNCELASCADAVVVNARDLDIGVPAIELQIGVARLGLRVLGHIVLPKNNAHAWGKGGLLPGKRNSNQRKRAIWNKSHNWASKSAAGIMNCETFVKTNLG